MSTVLRIDPRAPVTKPTVGSHLNDALQLQKQNIKTGWAGFTERYKSDGVLKAFSGLSTSSKVALGTLAVGGIAAIAVRRHRHADRVAQQEAAMQQGPSL
jgi:hypothetical protein